MGVRILNGGTYLGGRPVIDYRIIINDVTIGLTKEDFGELTKELGTKLQEDYATLLNADEKYKNQLDDLRFLREKLLRLLYGDDFEDGWLIRKDFNEMDSEVLDQLIEDHGRNLGLDV